MSEENVVRGIERRRHVVAGGGPGRAAVAVEATRGRGIGVASGSGHVRTSRPYSLAGGGRASFLLFFSPVHPRRTAGRREDPTARHHPPDRRLARRDRWPGPRAVGPVPPPRPVAPACRRARGRVGGGRRAESEASGSDAVRRVGRRGVRRTDGDDVALAPRRRARGLEPSLPLPSGRQPACPSQRVRFPRG